MDILNSDFLPKEAKIKYLDGDFQVISPGTFVRCAVTGNPIQVDELKYWSVDRQEAYQDAETSFKAYLKHRNKKD